MKKITPHLWFDHQAKEAAEFYLSLFEDSEKLAEAVLKDTPSGDAHLLTIRLAGQEFMLISAGPYFRFNPSISFLVACKSPEQVDLLWEKLIDGGEALMPVGDYPFAERYGWLADRYGLNWQLMYMEGFSEQMRITPTMMFVGEVYGKAEEAILFYTEVFRNSKVTDLLRYGEYTDGPDQPDMIQHAEFVLEGQNFAAMDSGYEHGFAFNEAVSFVVHCDTQEEIDYYWEKLSAVPEAEQCGWLKDMYGVSWQIVPTIMNELMQSGDPARMAKVTEAFLKMKKFNIKELVQAGS